ncbi:hypothetical protein OLX02_13640 [Novosphingobium sp. KCTC 2891]|uniref:chorismate--pyruvate lyase family protein n=1 Tax=Novosphingobium sp. KCTC 2891 TaxID=2989730 RepID=UPI0022232554|nr:hypothetical protein [Novosphingobium sp. KCTC 2891]MCW1383862.1 hypothetical protein [Novosphingobium sp. KCTC 2891]
MLPRTREAIGLIAAASLAGCAPSQLHRFQQALRARDSATAALSDWCRVQGIAASPEIRAIVDRAAVEAPDAETRALLGIGADEPVGFRHVRLACGGTVLSEAKNWYVPARLTPEMNRALETGDVPFGKVVAPLGFRRERLSEHAGGWPGCPADTVLSHRGLLRLTDGRAISLVIECYTKANFAKKG